MESANVVIDDSCDFSKEENISSLIEEIGDEIATDQPIATPKKTVVPVNLLHKLLSRDKYCETYCNRNCTRWH